MKTYLMPTNSRIRYLQWGLHLAIFPAIYYGTLGYWLTALVTFWLVHGIGSGIGAHRYFVHRSFTTTRFWEVVMAFLFTISCSGSVLGYMLIHRRHHSKSDAPGDPHDPAHNGFWKTWLGLYDAINLKFGPKEYMTARKDPLVAWFHDYYFGIIAAYALILALIDPLLLVFALAIPAIGQFHMNAILIALVHSKYAEWLGGYRAHETNDHSYNLWWLKPLALGEELHNNHHAKPYSVTMNLGGGWRDFDPLYYFIIHVMKGIPK
jgi:stearoyl-CoA desaturase (Delta-9 desaturase)